MIRGLPHLGALDHLVHALAVLAVALGADRSRRPRLVAGLFCAGIVVFSGTLYLLAITGMDPAGRGDAGRRPAADGGLGRGVARRLSGRAAALTADLRTAHSAAAGLDQHARQQAVDAGQQLAVIVVAAACSMASVSWAVRSASVSARRSMF